MGTIFLKREDYDKFVKELDAQPMPEHRTLMGTNNYKEYMKDPKKYLEKIKNALFGSCKSKDKRSLNQILASHHGLRQPAKKVDTSNPPTETGT